MAHPRFSVSWHRGKPVFTMDGRPVLLPSYCSCGPLWKDAWLAAHRRFADHGRTAYWLMPTGGYHGEWGTTPFWTGPNEVHERPATMPAGYFGIDEQARALLDMVPEAWFFVRMMDMPPQAWYAAHPDDVMASGDGRKFQAASLASEQYLSELAAFLRALTRHCESAPWADRVIGYVIYPLGEGGTPLAMEGHLFDHAPVMQRAFRQFLREKYGTDARLQSAWSDPAAAIDSAAVPQDEDFRRRNPAPVLFWPDASQVQRERDYFELQPRLFRRCLRTMLGAFREAASPGRLCGIDALKANMSGWMCHPVFTGKSWKTHYGDWILATGTTGMAEILDWPELDIVATPHDYRCRWVGCGYDPEGIGDSVWLHRKIMFVEEDQRSYANGERALFGSIEPAEEEPVLYRNLAASLTKGHQTYPMDVCVGYFESEAIQHVLRRRVAIEQHLLHVPREDVPSVVMLVDDRSAIDTDFSCEYSDLAVIRQRIQGMNHCGVPTRTFLMDDLRRLDFPTQHRLFLLPQCYRLDEAAIAVLRSRLFRNGHVIVFGPGSGITDGRTVSPEFASRLMGMEFELYDYEYPRFVTVDCWAHPVTRGMGASDTFGDSRAYGPVLVPWDKPAPECTGGVRPRRSAGALPDGGFVRLGTIPLDNGKRRPGLVVKEFGRGAAGNGVPGPRGDGDYAIVFTAAVPLPPRLLRNIAHFSGTHVYNEVDDVIYADSASVAVHAVMPGHRSIRLPGFFRVTDLVHGQPVYERTDRVDFEVTCPITRWFRVEPVPR